MSDPWVMLPFRVNPNVVLLDVRHIYGHGQTTNINIVRLTDNGSLGNGPFPVAVADMTADGIPEIIVGSGGGIRSRYYIVDGRSAGWWRGQDAIVLAEFTPFADDTWPVYLAAADVNGDGHADVITGQNGQGVCGGLTSFTEINKEMPWKQQDAVDGQRRRWSRAGRPTPPSRTVEGPGTRAASRLTLSQLVWTLDAVRTRNTPQLDEFAVRPKRPRNNSCLKFEDAHASGLRFARGS